MSATPAAFHTAGLTVDLRPIVKWDGNALVVPIGGQELLDQNPAEATGVRIDPTINTGPAFGRGAARPSRFPLLLHCSITS